MTSDAPRLLLLSMLTRPLLTGFAVSAMVTKGLGTIWGVDVSTKQIDVAIVAEDGTWQCNACVFRQGKDPDPGERMQTIHSQWSRFASALYEHFAPAFVFIERPTGRFPAPTLMMTAGVVAAGTNHATSVPVEFVAVASWKKAIGLGGNASKGVVRTWAEGRGGLITSQDAADALGIAAYGCSVIDEWDAPVVMPTPNV